VSPVDRRRLPVPGPEPAFTFPSAVKRTLANGLRLWTVRRDHLPMVSAVALLPAGATLDPSHAHGLAALTADMLDEGSGDRSAIQMQEALARLGTDIDTEAGPDAVVLSMNLLERFLGEGLSLLADMICRPTLAEADVTRVRDLRLNRLRQIKDAPGANAEAVFSRALYGPHAYGHLPIGTTASLERLGPAEVAAFHAAHYRPSRTTLVLVGAVDPDRAAAVASEAFGGWTSGATGTSAGPEPPLPVRRASASRLFIVDRPGAAQTELRVGHVAVPRHTPDFHALVLMNAVLGGHFMSRINQNLRERRGFTYGARSAYDFRKQAGPFSVQTSVQTEATAEAVAEILAELNAIRGGRPADEDELTLSSATLTKGYPRNFETSAQVARGLAQLVLYELPDDTFAAFSPRVRAVDRDTVTGAAVRHLAPGDAAVVAVGDRARIEDGLRRLDLGDPVVADPGL